VKEKQIMNETGAYEEMVLSTAQPPFLHDVLARWASLRRDRLALQFEKTTLSYLELDEAANFLAGALAKRGVRQGDLVLFMLPNRREVCITFFALARLGAVAVPINTALKGEGLRYIFEQTASPIALIDVDFLPRVESALGGWEKLEKIILVGAKEETALLLPGFERFETLLTEQTQVEYPTIHPGDPWAIMYTSGTTGPSKGVVLPYQMLSTLCMGVIEDLQISDDSVLYGFVPLFHLNAVVFTMGAAIMRGVRAIFRESFPRERLLADIYEVGATHISLPPFVVLDLLARPPQPNDRDIPLRVVYTFGLTEQQLLAFEARFDLRTFAAYGSTEVGLPIRLPVGLPQKRREKIASSGRIYTRMEVNIVDEHDFAVPVGQIGEVVCRPRYPYEMSLGYYRMPEATLKATRNLWFHTGDSGWFDQDGFFYFADRLKDMIKRRGENISSYEVEQVIIGCSGVHEVAVVPYRLPDSLEEEVRAFVVLEPESRLAPEEIVQYCSPRMAYYMVPRYLDFVTGLPRNMIGKVEKYKLRQEMLNAATFDYKAAGLVIER
jgi:crotonobetaine/carnitine-CoA ligase